MSFSTVNPATGVSIRSYQYASESDIEQVLQSAKESFQYWRSAHLQERKVSLLALAKTLRFHQDEFAQMMASEMGKPVAQGYAEVEKCASTCEYYAQNILQYLSPQKITAHYQSSEIYFEPFGLIFAIMPWNYPIWQVFRFAVPALAAGNIVVLKHSDLTAGMALLIEKIMLNAHPRCQLLFNLHVSHQQVERIIEDSRISAVTLTGSPQAGRVIAEIAGRHLKKCVLELGGCDAYIVLADADLSWAARQCAQARLLNCGQSCIAAKRFVVERRIFEQFLSLLKVEMSGVKMGDPQMEKTQLGPLASSKFQLKVIEQVEWLLNQGGRLLLGGQVPQEKGYYYPPTIVVFDKNIPELGNIEIFAPVAVVIAVDSPAEALAVANNSDYGLGGGVFTGNEAQGLAVLKEMQVGSAVLNDYVRSDARLPFGGVKESGYGYELSTFGLYEFCRIKTISIGMPR